MSSNDIPIIKLAFHFEWKVLALALKTDPNLEMQEFQDAGEVATYLSSVKAALIIVSVGNKQDFIQLASLLKIHKKVAPDTIVKIVVINFSGDKTYEKGTAKLGIQDLLEPGINTKALRFKVDFWLKGLNAQAKKVESSLAYKNATKPQAGSRPRAEETGITWQIPIECEDDIWLIKQAEDCKKVLGKWLVRLTGPSPYVAQWTEVNGRNNLWKFEFRKEERENFLSGDGNWYFKGEQKPDFVWKENIWMITGGQYDLYYQDSKSLTSWMSMENRILTICKNSEYAKTKESLIIESFDKEMVFRKDGALEANGELEQDGVDRFKNLEGKGKTEKLDQGPLSGKANTDDLSSTLLSMDLDPDENKLNDGAMRGPVTEKIKKPKDLTGPAGDGHGEGAELNFENKANEHKAEGPDSGDSELDKAREQKRAKREEEEEKNGSLALDDDHKANKKLHRKGNDKRVKGRNPRLTAEEMGLDEEVPSLDKARKAKDLQRALDETHDPSLEEAMESAEIITIMIQNNRKFQCSFDDFFDQSIIFSTRESGMNQNLEVEMDLRFRYLRKETKLKLNGRISEESQADEEIKYVTIQIDDDAVQAFEAFMKLYQIRQKNIDFFIKKVKGL